MNSIKDLFNMVCTEACENYQDEYEPCEPKDDSLPPIVFGLALVQDEDGILHWED